MINNKNYKKLLNERLKKMESPVIDCSLLEKKDFSKIEKLLENYNLNNKTSFWLDLKTKEIVDSNFLNKEKSAFKIKKLIEYLEDLGYENIALSESIASRKNTIMKLYESDLEKAEIVLASQLIVDKLQKVIESLSSIIYEEIIPISDKIKIVFGKNTSEYWTNIVKSNLDSLINNIIDAKDKIFKVNNMLEKSINSGMELNDANFYNSYDKKEEDKKENGNEKEKEINHLKNVENEKIKSDKDKNEKEFSFRNIKNESVENSSNEYLKNLKNEIKKWSLKGFDIKLDNSLEDIITISVKKDKKNYKIYKVKNENGFRIEGIDNKLFKNFDDAINFSLKNITGDELKINEALKIIREDLKEGFSLEKSVRSASLITGINYNKLMLLFESFNKDKKKLSRKN